MKRRDRPCETVRVNRLQDHHFAHQDTTKVLDAYKEVVDLARRMELELDALLEMERRVRAMLQWQWDDGDIDDECREDYEAAQRCLDDLESMRRLFSLPPNPQNIACTSEGK